MVGESTALQPGRLVPVPLPPAVSVPPFPACRTRVIYTETLSNPTLVLADIPRLAELAHTKVFPLSWPQRLPTGFGAPCCCARCEQPCHGQLDAHKRRLH